MDTIRFELDYIENDNGVSWPYGISVRLWEPYRVGVFEARGPAELAAEYHTYYQTTDPDFGIGDFLCSLRSFNFDLSWLVGVEFVSWHMDASQRIVAEINIADLILAKGTSLGEVLAEGYLVLELAYARDTLLFATPPDMPDGAIQAFNAVSNAPVTITPWSKYVGQIEPGFGPHRSAFYKVLLDGAAPPPDIFWTQRILCEETQ